MTHWSTRSLAQAAVQREIVPEIHATTVSTLLRAAKLQPHRYRYWKNTPWTEGAIQRALKILWLYERIAWLWRRGEVILALDEKPGIQVLERAAPTHAMHPGQVERQEFEYIRHGTVILLTGLTGHTRHMWAECLDRNDSAHFQAALRRCLHPYGWAKRIHLIFDEGSSHTSASTKAMLADLAPRVRVLLTPVDASWLNQAEALLTAFFSRYLLRGSWTSRRQMINHIGGSCTEYDHCFAHPFEWHWTRRDFRLWLYSTPGLIPCNTCATDH